MTIAVLALLAVITVAPLPLGTKAIPRWVGPGVVLALLAVTGALSTFTHKANGIEYAAMAILTVSTATFGGMPLPPAAFYIARRQPDSGDPLPARGGPLHGGRMVGVLERAAVSAAVLAGWPEGMVIVLGVKGLARYPDLRDSKASEQFIIGTFTSVMWAVAVAAIGRHVLDIGPWVKGPMMHEH